MVAIRYLCETCGASYATRSDAAECENRKPAPLLPVGLIFVYPTDGMNIVFATKSSVSDGHYTEHLVHACRDAKGGDARDNTWGEHCGQSGGLSKRNAVTPEVKKWPCFKRMVQQLIEHDIKPLIWNGTEAVPFRKGEG